MKTNMEIFWSYVYWVWSYITAAASWVSEKLHLSEWAEMICDQIHGHVEHFHPGDLELGS